MGNVFRGFHRAQQPKRKSKDRIAVTLIQDLEGRRVSARCCVEQPFVCYVRLLAGPPIKALDPAGTRPSYCLITLNRQKVTEIFRRAGTKLTRRGQLYYRSARLEYVELLALIPPATGL